MKTTKILNENDIQNLVGEFFAKKGLIVTSFEINLTSRNTVRFGQRDEHVFDNITVTVEEKPEGEYTVSKVSTEFYKTKQTK